jgi:hypothetical protein
MFKQLRFQMIANISHSIAISFSTGALRPSVYPADPRLSELLPITLRRSCHFADLRQNSPYSDSA